MEDVLLPGDFLERCVHGVTVDVRTPSEFAAGHIPGAINIPLFSDSERAEVGTLFVRSCKEKAFLRGLEFVGPKLAPFVKQASALAKKKTIYIYCWRGGMRSNSMAQLFRAAGLPTVVLMGGYKAYRHSFVAMLADIPWQYAVLGGPTGCGKTDILHAMSEQGHQVIDLEGLANNRGSVFGYLGQDEQPSTEHFANILYEQLRKFDPQRPVWLEAESPSIGRVYIHQEFYSRMLKGTCVQLEMDIDLRISNIIKDYGEYDTEMLVDCFLKIEKRLGHETTVRAAEHVRHREAEEAIRIGMQYYDKGYCNSLEKHWPTAHTLAMDGNCPEENAQRIIVFYESLLTQHESN